MGEIVLVDPPALPRKLSDAIGRRRASRRHPVIPEVITTGAAARAPVADLAGYVFLAPLHGLRLSTTCCG